MSEEKKEGSSCSSGGCGCCKGSKLLFGILIAGFIFASGMWFAQAHCGFGWHHHMGGGVCPFASDAPATK